MIWEQLRDYLEFDTKDADWVSFCVKKDYVLRVKATRDDNWYTGTYVQLVTDNYGTAIVIQLEGLPEDPYSSSVVSEVHIVNVPVQVFKLVGAR